MKYKYCKNIEEIENYAAAAADNFVDWDIHHRLETHNSDGVLRPVYLSAKELKALGMYYNRPASELIYMKRDEHSRLHRLNQHRTPETKAKQRASHLGKHLSDEARAKMRASHLGKHFSDETRAKIGAAHRGKHPSEETRAKISASVKLHLSKTSAKNN